MLVQSWATICDAGPSLMHYWINIWHKKKRNYLLKTFRLIYIMLVCIRILCFDPNNGQMTFKSKKVNFQGHMGQLTIIPICGSSEIKQLCGLRWGNKKSKISLSSFEQKWWVDENESFDNFASIVWAVSPRIAMAESGWATTPIARKQASNTDIQYQIQTYQIPNSTYQMTSDRPQ